VEKMLAVADLGKICSFYGYAFVELKEHSRLNVWNM
jgi:hypothetical protein